MGAHAQTSARTISEKVVEGWRASRRIALHARARVSNGVVVFCCCDLVDVGAAAS